MRLDLHLVVWVTRDDETLSRAELLLEDQDQDPDGDLRGVKFFSAAACTSVTNLSLVTD